MLVWSRVVYPANVLKPLPKCTSQRYWDLGIMVTPSHTLLKRSMKKFIFEMSSLWREWHSINNFIQFTQTRLEMILFYMWGWIKKGIYPLPPSNTLWNLKGIRYMKCNFHPRMFSGYRVECTASCRYVWRQRYRVSESNSNWDVRRYATLTAH